MPLDRSFFLEIWCAGSNIDPDLVGLVTPRRTNSARPAVATPPRVERKERVRKENFSGPKKTELIAFIKAHWKVPVADLRIKIERKFGILMTINYIYAMRSKIRQNLKAPSVPEVLPPDGA